MLRLLAVVVRLVAPTSSDLGANDVELAAVRAAEWFVELRVPSGAEMNRELDATLRSCGADNVCISGALEKLGIERALYVVVNFESGFVTAELFGRAAAAPLAAEAIELAGSVDAQVTRAVTAVLAAAGHRRGARLVVEVAPVNAIVRVVSSTIAAPDRNELVPGEPIYVGAGKVTIEASAPGFEVARRELELRAGEEAALRFELEPTASALDSWWLWGGIAAVAAIAVIVPVVVINSSDDPPIFCYGNDRAICESQR